MNLYRYIVFLGTTLIVVILWILNISQPLLADTDSVRILSPLEIHTSDGISLFQVELASTPETRQRGLMFRDELPRDEGMLFDFKTTRMVSMWMKDTLIPLDMLFISEFGIIITIEKNTEPRSLREVSSQKPVRAVLELSAGRVEDFNIQVGDRVLHKIFDSERTTDLTGTVRVIDGDSLWIGATLVNLYNIDAPEIEQKCQDNDGVLYACGKMSRNQLVILTAGREIRCTVNRYNHDGDRVGTCFVDGVNLNREMIARGWAVLYRHKKYDEDFLQTENHSRELKKGLWQGSFIMPWDWRKANNP